MKYLICLVLVVSQPHLPLIAQQVNGAENYGLFESIKFSPGGTYFATDNNLNSVSIWDVQKRIIYKTFYRHTQRVVGVYFLSDSTLLSASSNFEVFEWNFKTDKVRQISRPDYDRNNPYAFKGSAKSTSLSPNKQLLLLSGKQGTWMISLKNGQKVMIQPGVTSSAFTGDGKGMLLSGSKRKFNELVVPKGFKVNWVGDQTFLKTDPNSGGYISGSVSRGHSSAQFGRFPPSSTLKFKSIHDNKYHEIDISQTFKKPYNSFYLGYHDAVLTRDQRFAFVLLNKRNLGIINLETEEWYELKSKGWHSINISPDGKHLVSGGRNTIGLWAINQTDSLPNLLTQFDEITLKPGNVWKLKMSEDSKYLLSIGGGWLNLWDFTQPEIVYSLDTMSVGFAQYQPLDIHAEKAIAASTRGDKDHRIMLWDLKDKKLIKTLPGHDKAIRYLKFSADGKRLISTGEDLLMRVWSVDSGTLIKSLANDKVIDAVAFTEEPNTVVTTQINSQYKAWDIQKGIAVESFGIPGPWPLTNSRIILPEDDKLVTFGRFRTKVHSISERGRTVFHAKHDYEAHSTLFDVKTNRLYIGGDPNIDVWDIGADSLIGTLTGHAGFITSLALGQEGKFLYSASAHESSTKIWNTSSLKQVGSLSARETKSKVPEWVITLSNGYYSGNRKGVENLSISFEDEAYSFDLFDLIANRPDTILSTFSVASPDVISQLKELHQLRLEKSSDMMINVAKARFQVSSNRPKIKFLRPIGPITIKRTHRITAVASNLDGGSIKAANIWVNGVFLKNEYIRVKNENGYLALITFDVTLSKGKNRIGLSVENQNGIHSMEEEMIVNLTGSNQKPNLYLISVGVSRYLDSSKNLRFASKDAKDVLMKFKQSNHYDSLISVHLVEEEVTKNAITSTQEIMNKAAPDDLVVVYYSGHGGTLKDDHQSYVSTHNTNFDDPEHEILTFEELYALAENSPARQKIVLLDACSSGESVGSNDLSFGGLELKPLERDDLEYTPKGSAQIVQQGQLEKMKQMFYDLRRYSGTIAISSSGGGRESIEKDGNGVFTAALLEALNFENGADVDGNGAITINELQNYVYNRVPQLSDYKQLPTFRIENIKNDFVIFKK